MRIWNFIPNDKGHLGMAMICSDLHVEIICPASGRERVMAGLVVVQTRLLVVAEKASGGCRGCWEVESARVRRASNCGGRPPGVYWLVCLSA